MKVFSDIFCSYYRQLPLRFIPSVVLIFGVIGCAGKPLIAPEANVSQVKPESFENSVFNLLSDFYCKNLKWPSTWAQLEEFQLTKGEDASWLHNASEAQLSPKRAIFMTLSYLSEISGQRRATFIAPPSCVNPDKGRVSVAGEGVVFKLPEGYRNLALSEIKSRWKAPPYPDAAWGSEDGGLLAIRFGDVVVSSEELPQLLEEVSEAYESAVPELIWREKESRMVGGKPVLYYEFQSRGATGEIVNLIFSSVFDNHLFAISITGPSGRVDALRGAAKEIEESLKIR